MGVDLGPSARGPRFTRGLSRAGRIGLATQDGGGEHYGNVSLVGMASGDRLTARGPMATQGLSRAGRIGLGTKDGGAEFALRLGFTIAGRQTADRLTVLVWPPGGAPVRLPDPPPPVDAVPPTIGAFTPAAGSVIGTTTPVTFSVTDTGGAFRRIIVTAVFPRTGVEEVVHDGTTFVGHYLLASSRSAITNGFSFTVLRYGGWPSSPTLRVFAIDTSGNEAAG